MTKVLKLNFDGVKTVPHWKLMRILMKRLRCHGALLLRSEYFLWFGILFSEQTKNWIHSILCLTEDGMNNLLWLSFDQIHRTAITIIFNVSLWCGYMRHIYISMTFSHRSVAAAMATEAADVSHTLVCTERLGLLRSSFEQHKFMERKIELVPSLQRAKRNGTKRSREASEEENENK